MIPPSETPMSDSKDPAPTPPQQPAPSPQQAPRPGPRRDDGGRRPFPRGDRPRNDGSKPQDLAPRDFEAAKPNTRALDQSIEDELNAALAGFDVTGTVAKAQ